MPSIFFFGRPPPSDQLRVAGYLLLRQLDIAAVTKFVGALPLPIELFQQLPAPPHRARLNARLPEGIDNIDTLWLTP